MFWSIFEFLFPLILGAGWLALELIICQRLARLEKLISRNSDHLRPGMEIPMMPSR
jgi:hypothetical protein